jgi:hypothetical protein
LRFRWKEKLLEDIKKSPHENQLGGWLIVLLGFFLLGMAAFDSVPKLRAYRWVSGMAQVTATDMYERTVRSHDWCGRISYTYIVNGNTYKSRNLSTSIISDVGCRRDKAQVTARLAKLPPGASIRIFYDPTAPEKVAIVRESLKWHDGFFALFAGLTLVLGSYCIVQARRVLRS